MKSVEDITYNGKTLACIIRADASIEKTTFLTPAEFNFQVGFVVYPAKGEIIRHLHLPLQRRILGTSELLVVKKGRCEVSIYSDDRQLVARRELFLGDLILFVGGGHGFRMLDDTVLLEIKQGPYLVSDEKERF